jgi:hypothetical protein
MVAGKPLDVPWDFLSWRSNLSDNLARLGPLVGRHGHRYRRRPHH